MQKAYGGCFRYGFDAVVGVQKLEDGGEAMFDGGDGECHTPSAGTATFNGFKVAASGVNYTLTARYGSIEVQSSAFDVSGTSTVSQVISYCSGGTSTPAKTANGYTDFCPNGDTGTMVDTYGTDLGKSGTVTFKGNPADTATADTGVYVAVTWTSTCITCHVPSCNASSGTNVGTVEFTNNYSETGEADFIVCPDDMTYVPASPCHPRGSAPNTRSLLHAAAVPPTPAPLRRISPLVPFSSL